VRLRGFLAVLGFPFLGFFVGVWGCCRLKDKDLALSLSSVNEVSSSLDDPGGMDPTFLSLT